jgi:hypothetical protein
VWDTQACVKGKARAARVYISIEHIDIWADKGVRSVGDPGLCEMTSESSRSVYSNRARWYLG